MKWPFVLLCFVYSSLYAGPSSEENLKKLLSMKDVTKDVLTEVRETSLELAGKAIPHLIKTMKDKEASDKLRWASCFLVGRIMGKKASPFLVKFLNHPHWVLRMASLKTLLYLKENKYGEEYAKRLQDKALFVRTQALENIRQLKLKSYAPAVWNMLFDKRNYHTNNGKLKRMDILKKAILVVGELRYEKAKNSLEKMIKIERYKDLYPEIKVALSSYH